jgi:hypothetical protein
MLKPQFLITMFLKIMELANGNANSFSNNLVGGTAVLALGTNPSSNSNYRIDPDSVLFKRNKSGL